MESRAARVIQFDATSPTTHVTWPIGGDLGNNPPMRWTVLARDHRVGNDFAPA